jgi:hypothetical protein
VPEVNGDVVVRVAKPPGGYVVQGVTIVSGLLTMTFAADETPAWNTSVARAIEIVDLFIGIEIG